MLACVKCGECFKSNSQLAKHKTKHSEVNGEVTSRRSGKKVKNKDSNPESHVNRNVPLQLPDSAQHLSEEPHSTKNPLGGGHKMIVDEPASLDDIDVTISVADDIVSDLTTLKNTSSTIRMIEAELLPTISPDLTSEVLANCSGGRYSEYPSAYSEEFNDPAPSVCSSIGESDCSWLENFSMDLSNNLLSENTVTDSDTFWMLNELDQL